LRNVTFFAGGMYNNWLTKLDNIMCSSPLKPSQ